MMDGTLQHLKAGRYWYNVEVSREEAGLLKECLRSNGIYFEPSEAYNLIHFECLMNDDEVDIVNEFLRRDVYKDDRNI